MKSKFLNNICVISDDRIKTPKIPYIFITNLEKRFDDYVTIHYISKSGKRDTMIQTKYWIYKFLEIIDNPWVKRSFIEGVLRD